MRIFLIASQYYKLGNLYSAAKSYRRLEFSSNNLIFCNHNINLLDTNSKQVLLDSLAKLGVSTDDYNLGQDMPTNLARISIPGDKEMVADTMTTMLGTDAIPLHCIVRKESSSAVIVTSVGPSPQSSVNDYRNNSSNRKGNRMILQDFYDRPSSPICANKSANKLVGG